MSAVAPAQLRAFVERIERLECERADAADLIRQVYAEAKGAGFDKKALRKLIQRRKLDDDTRSEEDAILDLYESALADGSGA